MKLVLLLEDESNDIELVLRSLEKLVLICPVRTREEYIKALRENSWNLLILDLKVPKFSDFETITIARDLKPSLPIVVFTSDESDLAFIKSKELKVDFHILKNGFEELRSKVKQILKL